MASMTDAEREELACVYAALLLHDDGIAITADKIVSVVKAANIKVQAFWPAVFAKTLTGRNIDDLVMNAGSAPAAAAPVAATDAKEEKKGGKKEEKKEEKKKEEKPAEKEEEVDMGLDLFA